MTNEIAAAGFQRGAADYERARPSYPPAVLDALYGPAESGAGPDLRGRGMTTVDVAAGTGKLTRQLRGDVVAVEPVAAMRAVAATFAPTVAGIAEQVPLRDACADAVTVAQAFHWFDAPRALSEMRRLLRPGGTLLLVWNERDGRVSWVQAMTDAIHAHDPGIAYEHGIDWPAVVAAAGGFSPLEHVEVDNPQPGMTVETIVARALSTSYVAASGEPVRAQVAREVRAIVGDFDEPFEYPYVTQIFTCRRA